MGNMKMGFPQTRIMKHDFPQNGSSDSILKKGEIVKVVSSSQTRGCLVVEHKNMRIDVPFQVMELKTNSPHGSPRAWTSWLVVFFLCIVMNHVHLELLLNSHGWTCLPAPRSACVSFPRLISYSALKCSLTVHHIFAFLIDESRRSRDSWKLEKQQLDLNIFNAFSLSAEFYDVRSIRILF